MAAIQFFIDFALWRGLGMNNDNKSLQFHVSICYVREDEGECAILTSYFVMGALDELG